MNILKRTNSPSSSTSSVVVANSQLHDTNGDEIRRVEVDQDVCYGGSGRNESRTSSIRSGQYHRSKRDQTKKSSENTNRHLQQQKPKRKSKSASSFIRRLFTCAGVVASCTGGGDPAAAVAASSSSQINPDEMAATISGSAGGGGGGGGFPKRVGSSRKSQSKSISNLGNQDEANCHLLNSNDSANNCNSQSPTPFIRKILIPPILKLNDNDLVVNIQLK